MAIPAPAPDSWTIITGASQGIGSALAVDLARLGHNLILVARRGDVLKALADTLEADHGIHARPRPCDLSDREQRAQFIAEIANFRIAMIVNSAGIASFGPFRNADWNYEMTQFELNATAVFELTHAVLPGMLERGDGAILNVGSAAGNMPIPNNATYVFTKAGVNAFTEALHYELKGTGVTCTLLAPGPVREANLAEEDKSIVDRVVPSFFWTTYESCSRETLEAVALGKRRIVPGGLGKAMNALSQILPTPVLAPLMGRVYEKMGAE